MTRARLLIRAWVFLLGTAWVWAASAAGPDLVSRHVQACADLRQRLAADPASDTLGWQFARACFDLADIATNNVQRAAAALEGTAAARAVTLRTPGLAAGHYYLALNLGQTARTRGLSALKLVSEMEGILKKAITLDASFDHAGPDRSLAIVYRDAPGWPLCVGSKSKAREHLRKAVALAPDYPENRFYLIESLLKWGERGAALVEIKAAEEILPAARTKFSGPAWADEWAAWDAWWKHLQDQAAEHSRPPASPKQTH